jgi:hypothetical protein
MKLPLTIRQDWDTNFKPIADRFLPNHPQNLRGKLPYWYLRTRFKQYGAIDYDLPNRGLYRNADHGESLFVQHSAVAALGTTYFGLGAILPYHDTFFRAMWELDTEKAELVQGEKLDPDAPWAWRYFDDYPQTFTAGDYRLKIFFRSRNGYGSATGELFTSTNSQAGTLIRSGTLKKDQSWDFAIATPGDYILRITTSSAYIHLIERF